MFSRKLKLFLPSSRNTLANAPYALPNAQWLLSMSQSKITFGATSFVSS
jgi:hypothetical protein